MQTKVVGLLREIQQDINPRSFYINGGQIRGKMAFAGK
jgi:hypothetical protein